MITEKKNQHYLPRFYLRYFSLLNKGTQIGLYHLTNEQFVGNAKLKTQCSRNFYYGQDGFIENSFATLEGYFAELIKTIIENQNVKSLPSSLRKVLLQFVVLTDLRNPSRIKNLTDLTSGARDKIVSTWPGTDIDQLLPLMSHIDALHLSLSMLNNIVDIISDLRLILLINNTSIPFITSDFPVVRYNHYLEQKKYPLSLSKVGYGTVGLQILLPLNSRIMLLLYDSGIYGILSKTSSINPNTIMINLESCIDELNMLQFSNCIEQVFFNEEASESYIRRLHSQSKKFIKANMPIVNLTNITDSKTAQSMSTEDNLLHFRTTDIGTNLTIQDLVIHSAGKSHVLNNTAAQLRPHVMKYM